MTHNADTIYRNRNFMLVWIGQAISSFGDQLDDFALVWWIASTQKSALALAGASLAITIPKLLIGPLAGVYVDRLDRRKILIAANFIQMLSTLVLAWVLLHPTTPVGLLYICLGVGNVASAFQWPAMNASIPNLVKQEHLLRASALQRMMGAGSGLLAPAVAGLLVSSIGAWAAVAIDSFTFLIAMITVVGAQIPSPVIEQDQEHQARKGIMGLGAELLLYLWY